MIVFFAKTVQSMLVSPQAAHLSIYERKSEVLHLIRDTLLRDRKRRKYSPAPGRNQAHKLDSFALQALLYNCATTTAQVHFTVEYSLNLVYPHCALSSFGTFGTVNKF